MRERLRKLRAALAEVATRQGARRALREHEHHQIDRSRKEIEKLKAAANNEADPQRRREIEARIELRGESIERRVERLARNASALEKLADRYKGLKGRIARARRKLRRSQGARIYSRSEWGAAAPRGSYATNTGVTRRVMHHTAYGALSASASEAEEAAKMRVIQAGHFARGMTDIAYHRVVFPSGRIWDARPSWAIGAHTLNYNTGSAAVSADGNYEITRPTEAMIRAAERAFEGMPGAGAKLYGHFELNPTACPGAYLKPRLRDIA